MEYRDKLAVVTGAGSGIGRALALDLAGRGARLAISDVNTDTLADTVSACERAGAKVSSRRLDVANREEFLSYADDVVGEMGEVNLVVNNAGVALMATVEEMEWEDFEWLMGINFWGMVHGSKAFLPSLIASGDGHLVNISSVFGFVGIPTQSAYNASKFAIRGFTEALRQEMLIAGHPVAVSCVHPGGIKTNIARDARASDERNATRDKEKDAADFAKVARTTPEQAAKIILRGVDKKKAKILVGPDAYLFDAMARSTGSGYQRMVAAAAKRAGDRIIV